MADEFEYTADTIQVLTTRDAVRKRPGMYIGATDDGTGALHLLLEVAANAIDMVLPGRCRCIDIRVDADDTVTISDDGPGIPAHGLVALIEQPSDRPTADGHHPHIHLGLGGLGLPVVNALCDPFEVDTVHAGTLAAARYAAGLPREPLQVAPTSRPPGTRIRFRPDPRLFQCTRIPRVELTRRLEDLGFLLPAMSLTWTIAGDTGAGLVGLVRAAVRDPLGGVVHHRGEEPTDDGPITVEVALAWPTDSIRRPPQIHSFANLQRTNDGKHVDGLLDGLRAFLPRRRYTEAIEGMVAAVAVLLTDVRYGSPTKRSLANSAARSAVKRATLAALQAWAARSPAAAAALRRGER